MNFPTTPSAHDPPQLLTRSTTTPQPSNNSQQNQLHFQHRSYQQQQHHPHSMMNGMNGAAMAGGMPLPTPAGHQAELNYIYGMVEELSRQLAENRRVTEDIVSGLGRVRNRAKHQGLTNGDVVGDAASELNGKSVESWPIFLHTNGEL